MPYRTPEEWRDMIISGQLKVKELEDCVVGDIDPLKLHVANGDEESILMWVKDNMSKPVPSDRDGLSGMHIAPLKGYTEALKYLKDKGGDPDSVTADGYTPLGNAWRGGSAEACSVLLESGGDINCNYKDKSLILHILDAAKSDWNEERENAACFLSEICSKTKVKLKIPSDYITLFVSTLISSPVPYIKAYEKCASTFGCIEEIIRLLDDDFDASILQRDTALRFELAKIDVSDFQKLDVGFYLKNLKKASEDDALVCNENLRRFLEEYQSYKMSKIIPHLVIQRVSILNPSPDDGKLSITGQEMCHLKPELSRELLDLLGEQQDTCILGSVANHYLPLADIVPQALEAAGGGAMRAEEL